MIESKARERLYSIEENLFPHWKEPTKDKFLKVLYQQLGETYKKGREVSEDELKGIFGNGGH